MIKAAAIQIAPNLSSRAATTELVLDAIEEASSNGANFIVFPETFIPYYPYFSFVTPPVSQGKGQHVSRIRFGAVGLVKSGSILAIGNANR